MGAAWHSASVHGASFCHNKGIKTLLIKLFWAQGLAWQGAEGWEGAEALAASDSVPGHLYVTGGWRDIITNTCFLMGLRGTCVMGEQRGSNVQGCKREKGVTARKYVLVHTSADTRRDASFSPRHLPYWKKDFSNSREKDRTLCLFRLTEQKCDILKLLSKLVLRWWHGCSRSRT